MPRKKTWKSAPSVPSPFDSLREVLRLTGSVSADGEMELGLDCGEGIELILRGRAEDESQFHAILRVEDYELVYANGKCGIAIGEDQYEPVNADISDRVMVLYGIWDKIKPLAEEARRIGKEQPRPKATP